MVLNISVQIMITIHLKFDLILQGKAFTGILQYCMSVCHSAYTENANLKFVVMVYFFCIGAKMWAKLYLLWFFTVLTYLANI